MKIHEYQAKQLFRQAGVPVLSSHVARSPEEAKKAFESLGGGIAVVKAQIHAGGRGKGTVIDNPQQRGVQLVKSADDAAKVAQGLLGLINHQVSLDSRSTHYDFALPVPLPLWASIANPTPRQSYPTLHRPLV